MGSRQLCHFLTRARSKDAVHTINSTASILYVHTVDHTPIEGKSAYRDTVGTGVKYRDCPDEIGTVGNYDASGIYLQRNECF